MFQILVVEDNSELRELFCTVLEDNGYTAIPATKHSIYWTIRLLT